VKLKRFSRRKKRRVLLWVARAGFAGRGLAFLVLGGFAFSSIVSHWQPVGTADALWGLSITPAGWAAAAAVLLGLCTFALFRVIEAVADVHRYGDDLVGLTHRFALGAAGLAYTAYVCLIGSVLIGWRAAQSPDKTARDWVGWLLTFPGGAWIVALLGLAIVGVGIGLAATGIIESYRRRVKVEREIQLYVKVLGRIGFIARSLIIFLIGAFLVFAAVTSDPSYVKGAGGALQAIHSEPYGKWLLGALAAGLLAFGLFGLSEAAFAEIKNSAPSRP
jgi:hypothetical protein